MDLAGLAILIGVTLAAIRRLVIRPKSLESHWDDYYALVMLTLIPLVGFTMEAMRLIAASPDWSPWSPIGSLFAAFYRALGITPQTAVSVHMLLWWTHALLALTLIASIPFTKFRHLIMTPLNIIKRPRRPEGALEKIDDIDNVEVLGVGEITEFTSEQLLSFEACLNCGRCEENCPSTISGMQYSPRKLIQTLRGETFDTLIAQNGNGKDGHALLGETFSEEFPWLCTTCGACLERCPAFVNPVDEIIDLRRHLVLMTGKMPKSVGDTMRNIERQGNPWGMPPEDRISWADGLGVRELAPGDETDVLLFMGCAAVYDDRNKQVSRSVVRLLQKTNIDFGILGLDEACCGETARRMGHEYLFQVFAEQNIEMMSQIKFNRIVTQCPHCFNTLKNEYPQMGGEFDVLHFTELFTELSPTLEINSSIGNALQGTFAYHDSCYLGRYNDIYTAPRSLLNKTNANTVELSRRYGYSFCCGGGGGQMWMETDPNTRINHRRLQEVIDAKANIVTTACPYCLIMFDDAIRSKGMNEEIEVMDIAEVLEKAISKA
jgi:Fe-S oxidoreductase